MSFKRNVIALPSRGVTTSLVSGYEMPLMLLTCHHGVLLLLPGGIGTVTGFIAKARVGFLKVPS